MARMARRCRKTKARPTAPPRNGTPAKVHVQTLSFDTRSEKSAALLHHEGAKTRRDDWQNFSAAAEAFVSSCLCGYFPAATRANLIHQGEPFLSAVRLARLGKRRRPSSAGGQSSPITSHLIEGFGLGRGRFLSETLRSEMKASPALCDTFPTFPLSPRFCRIRVRRHRARVPFLQHQTQ
jgi:hypothetical protein